MDKPTLRKVYLEKRSMLSEHEYQKRNSLLLEKLKVHIASFNFNHIHIYLPIAKNKEPDTFPFIQYLWQNHPEIKISTGVSELRTPSMHHRLLKQETKLVKNRWGIPEPIDSEETQISSFDIVLVPMVIGLKNGHRIGYGKGYYDRFLSGCEQHTRFIGLSIGPLLEGQLPIDPYDVKLHEMITPFEVVESG